MPASSKPTTSPSNRSASRSPIKISSCPAARDGDSHDRRGIDVKLVDDGGVGAGGQAGEDGADLALHLLLGNVAIFFQHEDDVEAGNAFLGGAAEFVDAGDGVDGFFQDLGDAGLHFLDAGASAGGGDGDDGEIDVGEEVGPHVHVGEEPDG